MDYSVLATPSCLVDCQLHGLRSANAALRPCRRCHKGGYRAGEAPAVPERDGSSVARNGWPLKKWREHRIALSRFNSCKRAKIPYYRCRIHNEDI